MNLLRSSKVHSPPLAFMAAEKLNPRPSPRFSPTIPNRFGPTRFGPPFSNVWQAAHFFAAADPFSTNWSGAITLRIPVFRGFETAYQVQKAREEGEQIIGAAQEQAAILLQDQSILREAEQQAGEMEKHAQTKADETMRGADQYASDVLIRLESDLVKTLSIVKKSLEVLEERRPEPVRE